ncbi:Kdo domain containing protein [Flavobacterium amnicola]|uniref:Kdo domain containing protein n=1 Tax=Flavobacterium amnicola TaxID=2506422 RepID=A0A4V1N1Y0_9FLAO|nr:lipopolysaccharide kinase InaA family protein [Flavobacterium amnicola]RXR19078.1 Kdo domain containing protein [Flavobacterium amnicola]
MDKDLHYIIENFNQDGTLLVEGKRNIIKNFPYKNTVVTVKSFKIPLLLNGIIYRFFRESKAKRSYDYAKKLESCNIGTPKPIAFYENKTWLRLKDSYYICEFLEVDYVFNQLFNVDIPDLENILQQFARFCFKLHDNGIEFLDHSPGNTLIKKVGENQYDFYLIDLNRMKFHNAMDFDTRMKNMSRLTPNEYMIKVISYEYAKLYHKSEEEVFNLMWKYTSQFYHRADKKRAFKEKYKL